MEPFKTCENDGVKMMSRLDAFEMWVYHSVLKMSWTEKITNEEVLRRMGTDREIVRQFKTRKLQYLGHLIRHNSSQLQLIELLEGKIEGRRSRGRPRNTWTTDITTTKGLKYYQQKRAAEDRKRWHGLVVEERNMFGTRREGRKCDRKKE